MNEIDEILKLGTGTTNKQLIIERIEDSCKAYLKNNNSDKDKKFLIQRIIKLSKELED